MLDGSCSAGESQSVIVGSMLFAGKYGAVTSGMSVKALNVRTYAVLFQWVLTLTGFGMSTV